MFPYVLRILLCIGAGYALWRLWRMFDAEDRFNRWMIFIGFMVRSIAGVVLFWIPYLRLPIAPSLQHDNGLWFFAVDAELYMAHAAQAVDRGVLGILLCPRSTPSVTFVQALSLFELLFGRFASGAVLLNVFCYLATCAVIIKWKNALPEARLPAAIAIAAITISPSVILWSLQPLKDPLFQFLIVSFVAACAFWQKAWQEGRTPATRLVVIALVMTATLFGLAGVRWYVGLTLVAGAAVFLLLTAASASRKWTALAAAIVLQFVLVQAFVLSARPYISPQILRVLTPFDEGLETVAPSAVGLVREVESARDGFERTGGATSIGMGRTLERFDRPEALEAGPNPALAGTVPGDGVTMPSSPMIRIAAGAAAVLLPSSVAGLLGLVEIRGGRGLWWFTDVDTLVFDAVLLIALVYLARRLRRASWRNPTFWLVVILTLVGLPMLYVVSNYGTLFRLRTLIYIGAFLTPLALTTRVLPEPQ